MLSVHVEIVSMRQFQCLPTTYDAEKRGEVKFVCLFGAEPRINSCGS